MQNGGGQCAAAHHRRSQVPRARFFLRRPDAATACAPMHRLSSPSRPLLSFMASGPARWWPSALARRVTPCPCIAAHDGPVRRVSRFPRVSRYMASSSGVNVISGDEDASRASFEVTDSKRGITGETVDITGSEEDRARAATDHKGGTVVSDYEEYPSWDADPIDGVYPIPILPNSRHRDGSIYKDMIGWKKDYHIADRNETRLEAMMFSDPADCEVRYGASVMCTTRCMLQIISLKLAKIPADYGPVELYGYIAVRERRDPLLNYVIKLSRDDPMIVEQGSLLNMTGPKRGITLSGTNLVEYDMRIKRGQQEKDYLQLIDGVSIYDRISSTDCHALTQRILGDCGAIDITAAVLYDAVEATVEVVISEVQISFNLSLGCFSSGLHDEIRLFDGTVGESRDLRRSMVAVVMDTHLELQFKVGADSSILAEHCCSFKANDHGHSTQEIKTDFALISAKVTWSTFPYGLYA